MCNDCIYLKLTDSQLVFDDVRGHVVFHIALCSRSNSELYYEFKSDLKCMGCSNEKRDVKQYTLFDFENKF